MTEQATETEPITEAPTTDMHVGEELGALRARVDDLDAWRTTHEDNHAPKADVIEEIEATAEVAETIAEFAIEEAHEAEEGAEVAEEVAIVAAEIAVEAEQTAEVAEEVAIEEEQPGEVVEVPVEEPTAEETPAEETPSETTSSRARRRRGVYGKR